MKRSFVDILLLVIAWAGLILGILFSLIFSIGQFKSGMDMSVERGFVWLVSGVGASVLGWAVLKEMVSISDRLRKLENKEGR